MLLIIGFIFLLLTILGYYKGKDLFSPDVLVSGVWFMVILLYYLLPHNFYPIQNRFPLCIIMWVVGYYVSAQVVAYVTPCGKNKHLIDRRIYVPETILACFATVYLAYSAIKAASGSELFFLYLRSLSTGLDENISTGGSTIWGYFRSAMLIVYLIELTRTEHFSKKRTVIFLLLNLLVSFVTMAKSQLFTIVVTSLVVLYRKKRISRQHILVVGLLFLVLCIIIQILRSNSDSFSISSFLASYILSGSVAFDYFDPNDVAPSGSNVFRFFEALLYRLGISDNPSNQTILQYIQIGGSGYSVTNVYTMLYPFFTDYGYAGVAAFAIICGSISGYFYKKSKSSDAALVFYSVIASTIIFGFMGELFFTNFSTMLQYLIFTYMPFYIVVSSNSLKKYVSR